jgi:hypothetical protein
VTIIGIPLLVGIPFLILGFGIVALVGFTAVANRVGHWVAERLGWGPAGPLMKTFMGIVTILSPLLLARVLALIGVPFLVTGGLMTLGFLFEYLAWTIGFGAVALLKFQKPATSSLAAASVQPQTSEG